MTALDFVDAGIVFSLDGGRLVVRGPAGRVDLLELLRAAVARRLPLVTGELPARMAGGGLCLCGDETELELCELCQLAKQKATDQPAEAPAMVAKEAKSKKEPPPPKDPWKDVERECPGRLLRGAHAGRLHIMASGFGSISTGQIVSLAVQCLPWRPLLVGERASDAWIEATRHRVVRLEKDRLGFEHRARPLEVPGAQEALYPPPTLMRFQLDVGQELDRAAERNGAALRAFYETRRRPAPAAIPLPSRRRAPRIPDLSLLEVA
jgi:hypothetical protein